MSGRADFLVHILRLRDGRVVVSDMENVYRDPTWQAQRFWWTEGNFGCDCNRSNEFDDCTATDEECSIGTAKRFVIWVTDRRTGAVLYDERT